MQKPEASREKERHKILWIQTDYQIQARRVDLVLINKPKELVN